VTWNIDGTLLKLLVSSAEEEQLQQKSYPCCVIYIW